MLGVPMTSAMRLSGLASDLSLGAYRGLGDRALGAFNDATGDGALNVEPGVAINARGTILRSTQVSPGQIDSTTAAERVAALSEMRVEGGAFERLLVAATVAVEIAAIMDDDPATQPSLIDGPFANNIAQISRAAARGEISLDDGPVDVYRLQAEAVTTRVAEMRRQAEPVRLADQLRAEELSKAKDLERRKQEALDFLRRSKEEQRAEEERRAKEEERKTVGRDVSHCLKLFEIYAPGVHYLINACPIETLCFYVEYGVEGGIIPLHAGEKTQYSPLGQEPPKCLDKVPSLTFDLP